MMGMAFPGLIWRVKDLCDCLPLHVRSAEIESFARVTIAKDLEDVYAAISLDHEDRKYFMKTPLIKTKTIFYLSLGFEHGET